VHHSVNSQSIRDCYHLGKYTQSDHPRPLVAVLNKTADVSEILTNRGNLRRPYYVKPDMNPEEELLNPSYLKRYGPLLPLA